jgi:hypothetical protein
MVTRKNRLMIELDTLRTLNGKKTVSKRLNGVGFWLVGYWICDKFLFSAPVAQVDRAQDS